MMFDLMEKIAFILCMVTDFVKPVLWGGCWYATLDERRIDEVVGYSLLRGLLNLVVFT